MYHESTPCISILFFTIKHDKIKNNCVIVENIFTFIMTYSWKNIFIHALCCFMFITNIPKTNTSLVLI